jgi:hypothetical protein
MPEEADSRDRTLSREELIRERRKKFRELREEQENAALAAKLLKVNTNHGPL